MAALVRLYGIVWRRVGRTSQEAVKLHQELEVDIVALGGSAVSALDVVAVEIDTCEVKPSSAFLFKHAQKNSNSVLRFREQDGAMIAEKEAQKHTPSLLAYRG